MAHSDDDSEAPPPNLPVVPVRGITDGDAMLLYERYHLEFTPPGYTERKLCEVIVALEELIDSLSRRK